MQEIAGAKPLNFHVALPLPPVRPPVTRVAATGGAGASGSATDGRASGDSRHPGATALPADPRLLFRPDRFTLTGPSPAFQATLLEVERDFRNVLARIEAARAKAEADQVYGAAAKPAKADAEASVRVPSPEPAPPEAARAEPQAVDRTEPPPTGIAASAPAPATEPLRESAEAA